MVDNKRRFNTYEQMTRMYLGQELIQNIYEREKLLNHEFTERDEKIHLRMKNAELKDMIYGNVKKMCLEMYRQGVRDIIEIMKGY